MSEELPIHARVERALAEELKTRVPELVWHQSQDVPEGEPPYGVIQCDEAQETTPKSGVFYVNTAILVTHPLGEVGSVEHRKSVKKVREALEGIPRPGYDEINAVRIYGFEVRRQVAADVEQEQGTLFELRVGCGAAEKQGA